MNAATLSDWIHLGGYGPYVWPAYGLTLLVVLVEPWLLRRRTRRALALDESDSR